jgi:hypothetical protein
MSSVAPAAVLVGTVAQTLLVNQSQAFAGQCRPVTASNVHHISLNVSYSRRLAGTIPARPLSFRNAGRRAGRMPSSDEIDRNRKPCKHLQAMRRLRVQARLSCVCRNLRFAGTVAMGCNRGTDQPNEDAPQFVFAHNSSTQLQSLPSSISSCDSCGLVWPAGQLRAGSFAHPVEVTPAGVTLPRRAMNSVHALDR